MSLSLFIATYFKTNIHVYCTSNNIVCNVFVQVDIALREKRILPVKSLTTYLLYKSFLT